ncbi:MAG: NTP transferase domain-containing protein [Pseudomonadota bacterium]
MIFASLPLAEAEGALLVHSLKLGKLAFRKGRKLSAEDLAALSAAGVERVTVVRLEPGDVGEDEAAARIAAAVRGDHLAVAAPFTGRANLIAQAHGVLVLDKERLDRLNAVDEAVTLATLPPYDVVAPGDMVATVKIIPFSVPAEVIERCLWIVAGEPLMRVAALRPRPVSLIQTRLPGIKESVLDKTLAVMNDRLAALGAPPAEDRRCAHEEMPLAAEIEAALGHGAEMVLIAGASAITDRRDVLPAAIERAGGAIDHFGMPVDPGNLLLMAHIGARPVLGLPGCVRSPKLNGFDWVLQRLMADLPVTRRDIMAMGAGGLLKEIPTRPQPRAGAESVRPRAPNIAAIVLAAGRSSRMGGANKLLAELDDKPLVAHAIDAALAARVTRVVVVTGHEAERVRQAIAGRPVEIRHNPDYASGIAGSLAIGLAALKDAEIDGALVLLGDMPRIAPGAIDRLIAAFNPTEGRAICVPTFNGKRGNPVLWAKRFFEEMAHLKGDVGARHLIGAYAEQVAEVAMPDDAVLTDVDTPQALEALRRAGDKTA